VTGTRHVVVAGDNLWSIAATTLRQGASERREGVRNAEIVPYWKHVIAENRPALRSGNPDLIFPGESIQLPPAS
jgi:nucleoid-associated protein YgaU